VTDPAAPTVAIWRSVLLLASETFVRGQGEALTRWRPTFVGAVKADSPLSRDGDLIAFPGPHGRRDFLRLRLTGRSPALRRVLRAARPALVHAHFGGDGWLVSRSAAQVGVPLVVTLHGHDVTKQPHTGGVKGIRYRRNLRTVFDRAALLIAVSAHIRDRAVALGADPAKVRVHHTGVPVPPRPVAAAKRWDLLFVGRFVEKKGVDDLVEAVGTLTDPRPRVLFIGGGPLEARMRDRAAALGLDATFLGAQEPAVVARSMVESRIFVAPSRTAADGDAEGLPTTILEAASLGLPTVSTRHSGIPEAVVHGETGLLGAEGDRSALAAHIRRLLADEHLRTRLGEQARRHVEDHFDLVRQTRLLEDIYDSVVVRPSVATDRVR
jgi:colanic acid/amylovoran biosynthesis glycosyltransferase